MAHDPSPDWGDETETARADLAERRRGALASLPDELLRSVVAYFHPRKVILFGSLARGEAGKDADIDLLVVLDDDAPRQLLSWRASYEARRDDHRACDIVPCRVSVFERRSKIVGSLPHTIATEGETVYERD